MDESSTNNKSLGPEEGEAVWQMPAILEEGRIEAKLFSDEPDPWGGP